MPLLVCLLIGAAAAAALWKGQEIHTLKSPVIGKPVPAFSAGAFTADTLKGQVSVLNFYASWCGPCALEHKNILRLSESGVRIYGVSYRDDPRRNADYLKRMGNPYIKIANDAEGTVSLAFGVYAVPTTIIIDRHGMIVYRLDRPLDEETLHKDLLPKIRELQR